VTVTKAVNAQCHPARVTPRCSRGPVDGPQPCCQLDSNPHWADFKSAASADWAMGVSHEFSASTPETV
jgi:hypothetical protein